MIYITDDQNNNDKAIIQQLFQATEANKILKSHLHQKDEAFKKL